MSMKNRFKMSDKYAILIYSMLLLFMLNQNFSEFLKKKNDKKYTIII
jgi:hypothetical protein